MNKLLTLRCDALFQGRLAQSLSWRPPKVQTHKFPANNIQIEFGNKYNSARLKLHSYVDFVWYLIQNNGDLDQFLKITKSQQFLAWMVQIFHKMPKRVCSIGEKWRRSRLSKNQVHEAEPRVNIFRSARTSYGTIDSRPPARPSRAKNPDHLYSLINHHRTTANLSNHIFSCRWPCH